MSTSDITEGLDMGADDYITKPFHISVLISRIQAVLRRSPELPDGLLTCGAITLHKERIFAFALALAPFSLYV